MKIYIAGIDGMIGSECKKKLEKTHEIIGTTYKELDLLDYDKVLEFVTSNDIDLVIMAAAKVGGGHAIYNAPVEFLEDNIQMQINLMRAARQCNINRFIFIASAAVYPAMAQSPISESQLLKGELDSIQEAYGLAKLMGLYSAKYSNRQYGTKFITVIPTNVIATRDNGQVVYSLFKQMNEAKKENKPNITLWGSGNQRREFIFTEDLVEGICVLIENYDNLEYSIYNIGAQNDLSIKELAYMIKEITAYEGELVFDTTKPEGVSQRLLDSSRLFELGFKPKTELREGLLKIQSQFDSKSTC